MIYGNEQQRFKEVFDRDYNDVQDKVDMAAEEALEDLDLPPYFDELYISTIYGEEINMATFINTFYDKVVEMISEKL